MQPSPSITIDIQRFDAWRGAVTVSAAMACAALLAWAVSGVGDRRVVVLSGGLICTVVLAAVSLWRSIVPVRLDWDGRDWSLTRLSTEAGAPRRGGRLAVTLDLGAFLLLRFEDAGGARLGRHAWIPVGRRGLEAQWHSLRCAVYCARPSHDGSADPAR